MFTAALFIKASIGFNKKNNNSSRIVVRIKYHLHRVLSVLPGTWYILAEWKPLLLFVGCIASFSVAKTKIYSDLPKQKEELTNEILHSSLNRLQNGEPSSKNRQNQEGRLAET